MSNYEEIKKLLKASKSMLSNEKTITENRVIGSKYGIILEQPSDVEEPNNITTKDNPYDSIENEIKQDEYETADSESTEKEIKKDKKKGYRISGGLMYIHGGTAKELQLTTDDKTAFQESMDEFVNEVAEIVDFNKLNLYPNNVEWSGKITEYDLEFFFSIGESNGVYINGTMMKIDENFLEMLNKLKTYYEKFKTKWSKVISARKKTKE